MLDKQQYIVGVCFPTFEAIDSTLHNAYHKGCAWRLWNSLSQLTMTPGTHFPTPTEHIYLVPQQGIIFMYYIKPSEKRTRVRRGYP